MRLYVPLCLVRVQKLVRGEEYQFIIMLKAEKVVHNSEIRMNSSIK
jgi:hypothetical protein